MKKFRNFKCAECEEVFERLVEDNVTVAKCSCDGAAMKMLSAPRCFQNTTGKSPSTT